MTLAKFLNGLVDPAEPLRTSELLLFSNIIPEDLDEVGGPWRSLPDHRRHEVVARMIEMADDSPDLDYGLFFRFALADPFGLVRERSIMGLWECEDRSVLPLLLHHLACDPDPWVRAAAAMVLGRFATLAQCGKLLERDGQKVYAQLLARLSAGDEQLEVRRRSLESLAVFQDEMVHQWIRWGYNSPSGPMRESALYAMGRNCNAQWLGIIVAELESEDAAMRYEAANACREMADEGTVPQLALLLHDDDMQVQVAAIQALGAIGSVESKRHLRQWLGTAPDDAARAVAEATLEQASEGEARLRLPKRSSVS